MFLIFMFPTSSSSSSSVVVDIFFFLLELAFFLYINVDFNVISYMKIQRIVLLSLCCTYARKLLICCTQVMKWKMMKRHIHIPSRDANSLPMRECYRNEQKRWKYEEFLLTNISRTFLFIFSYTIYKVKTSRRTKKKNP